MGILLSIILLIVGFVLLIKSADVFVDGCSNVAKFFGIPTLIIGLTIVAFGTSAPEAAVSLSAALKGNNAISIGNVVGSNIANLLLILGTCGLFSSLTAKKKIITRDFVYSLLATLVLFIMVATPFIHGETEALLTRENGLILLCFLGIYVYSLIIEAKASSKKEEKQEKTKFNFKNILFIVLGLLGIILGGQLVVDSATKIAKAIGVSDHVIALTVIAIGTSLPELVTSIVATRKGEVDIAIGNVIGSNIFNVLFILGITSVVCPLSVVTVSFIDIIIMMAISVLVYIFTLKNYRIGHLKGKIMLTLYVAYTIYVLVR